MFVSCKCFHVYLNIFQRIFKTLFHSWLKKMRSMCYKILLQPPILYKIVRDCNKISLAPLSRGQHLHHNQACSQHFTTLQALTMAQTPSNKKSPLPHCGSEPSLPKVQQQAKAPPAKVTPADALPAKAPLAKASPAKTNLANHRATLHGGQGTSS